MSLQRQHTMVQLDPGGLKFVRWPYTAKHRSELTVRKGDEVSILKRGSKDDMYKVNHEGHVGYIPEKCFYPRNRVNFTYESEYDGEISVTEGDVIGIIDKNVGGSDMYMVMKDDIEGNIPEFCLHRKFEAYADHTAKNQEQLSIKKGDFVALVEEDSFDVDWTVYLRGKKGQVPSKCFEPPQQVHWEYQAKKENEITVQRGDTVTLVDHHRPQSGEKKMVRVRLGEKIGCIPRKSFEVPAEVYWPYAAANATELSVKKKDTVALVEVTGYEAKPPEGYIKARLGINVGYIPKYCFEIPAQVIRDYTAAKGSELTVKKGQEVRVMDATMNIQVRFGDKKGEVPFSCINANVHEIVSLLEKTMDDDDDAMQQRDGHESRKEDSEMEKLRDSEDSMMIGKNVDAKALCSPLGLCAKEDAMYYLQGLEVNKIGDIGNALGLSLGTMIAMNGDNFQEEVVRAWLEKKDKVGTPTWKSLGSVLKKNGCNEAAEKISKDNTRFEIAQLTKLSWNVDGKEKKLKITTRACLKWRNIAPLIGLPDYQVIEDNRGGNNQRCFEDVMNHWIQDGGTEGYPATWLGLRTVLRDSELGVLAHEIQDAMQFLNF